MTRPELRVLTSLRGLAAWFVVLYHIRLSIAGLSPGALHLLAQGYLAVDFFFLLSGFVIWMTWAERLRANGWREVPYFLQKRVARIWPLHLVMLGFAVVLVFALEASGRADPPLFPFDELPLHVLLLQNWGFTDALTWNNPSWSISTEFAAYLVFPLLALAIDWRRVPSWALGAVLVALFTLLDAIYLRAGAPTLGNQIVELGLIRCLCEFAAGTVVGALWLRWRAAPALPIMIAAGIAAVAIAAILLDWIPSLIGAPPAFAALLLAAALSSGRRGHPLEGRVLHALGEASYATYLSHFLLWFAFKLVFVDNARGVSWSLVALYLAIVLGASFALYHWVERPAQRWVNRFKLPSRLREGLGGGPVELRRIGARPPLTPPASGRGTGITPPPFPPPAPRRSPG